MIKDGDMFGHNFAFNFEKKGETYNTLIGGIMSILVKVLLFAYVIIKFNEMVQEERDNNITSFGSLDL